MKKKLIGAVLAITVVASIAIAGKSPKVTLVSKQYKEISKVNKQGHVVKLLEDIKKVVPGDVIVYKNVVSNFEEKALENLVLNNKVPKHTDYIKNSAKCVGKCNILLSNDGGKTFLPEKELKTRKPVTNVRWILLSSVKQNAKETVSYKVKVQ